MHFQYADGSVKLTTPRCYNLCLNPDVFCHHGYQEFKGTAKEILGTCFAVGCTVDGQKPGALQQVGSDVSSSGPRR